MAMLLFAGAIQSVSADPDALDDYLITHHAAGHSAGELQHSHTFHFDNLVYLHSSKQLCFGQTINKYLHTELPILSQSRFISSVWQPPKN